MGDQKYVMVFYVFANYFVMHFEIFFSVLNTRYVFC